MLTQLQVIKGLLTNGNNIEAMDYIHDREDVLSVFGPGAVVACGHLYPNNNYLYVYGNRFYGNTKYVPADAVVIDASGNSIFLYEVAIA